MISIAQLLRERGHEVAFVTSPTFKKTLAQAGLQRIPRGEQDGESFQVDVWAEPIAVAIQVKHIEYALAFFKPDVLVGQQLTLGPLIAADRYSIPTAVVGLAAYLFPTSAALRERPLQSKIEERLVWRYQEMMKFYNQARELFQMPQSKVDDVDTPLLGDLFLLQSIPELEVHKLPARVHLVGSCLWEPPQFDFELANWLRQAKFSQEPVIYVQPGRAFQFPRFWSHLLAAFGDCPVRVVAAIGRMDGEAGSIPDNFFVRNHVPQELVLSQARAVISSGHTTAVLGALTHGLPSLLIPSGSGTEDITERCQEAGAAITLSPDAVTVETLKQSLEKLLHCPNLRQNAQKLQSAFAKINGSEKSADLLELLAINRCSVLRQIDRSCIALGEL